MSIKLKNKNHFFAIVRIDANHNSLNILSNVAYFPRLAVTYGTFVSRLLSRLR